MRLFRRRPSRFDALARYSAEKARGLVHTPEWVAQMAVLQADWDEQQEFERVERLTREAGGEDQSW